MTKLRTQLSRLVDLAMVDEEVVIAEASKPLVKLTAITVGLEREFGFARGLVRETLGSDAPLSDDEALGMLGAEL